MSKQFYKIKTQSISKTTKDCSVIDFTIPKQLQKLFTFQSGQHLTFRKKFGDQDIRRNYSLCSAPHENKWSVAVKRINGGLFSSFINDELKEGDELEIMPPLGEFNIPIVSQKKRHLVAFVAGSGITPILSLVKTHLKEEDSSFTLFYVNKSVQSIILKEELEALKNQYINRLQVFHLFTKEKRDNSLFNGRFTEDKLKQIYARLITLSRIDGIFLCGPQPMIETIKKSLIAHQFPIENIHFELFTTVFSNPNSTSEKEVLAHQADSTEVILIDGGKEFHFNMTKEDNSILDAALSRDADLPFACKGGVCCTCKAKIKEGTVEMKVNYALEKEEVEQGYILSCQAIPTSSKVIIDYDV